MFLVFSSYWFFLCGWGFLADMFPCVQWAAAKGYNVIPVDRLQRLVKGVNLQKAVSQHKPFKISFGATMALAAFAQF